MPQEENNTKSNAANVEKGCIFETNIRQNRLRDNCKRKGYYSSQCRSKSVAPLTSESKGNLGITFLDTASTEQKVAQIADIQLSDQGCEIIGQNGTDGSHS